MNQNKLGSVVKSFGQALRHPRNIFFGWRTVVASGIMCSWGYGIYTYGFGSLYKPLQNEFGWTRAEISVSQSLSRFEGGLEGPLGGSFSDRFGPRIVNSLGFLIGSIGLFLMYFVNSLWTLYISWGIVGFGFQLGLYNSLDVAILNWFVRKRGLALSINRTIAATLTLMTPPFFAFLVLSYGWRTASLMGGLICLAFGLPLTWFFVRPKRPEYYGLMPDGASTTLKARDTDAIIKAGQDLVTKETGEIELTLKQAMRTRAFWILIIVSGLNTLVHPLVGTHGIPKLIDMGVDPVTAASIIGLVIFVSVPGRLLGGYFGDRSSINRLKYMRMIGDSIMIFGLFIFLIAKDLSQVYLFVVVYGTGFGMNAVSTPQIRGRFFGRKAIGTIAGTMMTILLPVGTLVPIYIGWMYDSTGSYTTVMWQAIILSCIGIVSLFFLNPPKRNNTGNDIKNNTKTL